MRIRFLNGIKSFRRQFTTFLKCCANYAFIFFSFCRAKAKCTSMGSQLAVIPDDFTHAWAFSMLADPTENPDTALPSGIAAWIGLRGNKKNAGGTLYSWINKWYVHHKTFYKTICTLRFRMFNFSFQIIRAKAVIEDNMKLYS